MFGDIVWLKKWLNFFFIFFFFFFVKVNVFFLFFEIKDLDFFTTLGLRPHFATTLLLRLLLLSLSRLPTHMTQEKCLLG